MNNRFLLFLALALCPAIVFGFGLTWHYTGSMNGARWLEVLAVLPEGKVLAIGGDDASGNALATCEVYDVATETWTAVAPMSTPRERHTATVLGDGRVVVIGGNTTTIFNYGFQTASVEIYDPATGQWSDGGQLLQARQDHSATLLPDGTILVVGGWGGSRFLSFCEIYDPQSHTSRAVSPLLQERYDHQAVLLTTGEVLVAGGRIGGWDGTFFSECEVYTPSTDTWRRVQSMLESRIIGSLQAFSDGTVLAAGGRNSPTSTTPGAEILDPNTMTWQPVHPMFQPCSWSGNISLPFDRFLTTGGFIDANWTSNNSIVATPTCEWYEKELGRWFYAPELQQTRAKHSAVYLHQRVNHKLPEFLLLVAGGITGDNTYTSSTEYLDFDPDAVAAYKADQANVLAVEQPAISAPFEMNITGNPGPSPVALITLHANATVQLDLVSSQGIVLQSIPRFATGPGDYALTIGTTSLPNGVYFLRASTSAGVRTARVCVVR